MNNSTYKNFPPQADPPAEDNVVAGVADPGPALKLSEAHTSGPATACTEQGRRGDPGSASTKPTTVAPFSGPNLIGFCLLFVWLGVLVVQATDRYVTPPGGYGTNNPPYINWADAATNIQWAVNVATNGDTVWVTNGNYRLTNSININTNLTLKSVNGRDVTFINGNYPYNTSNGIPITNQCIYIGKNGVVVDGFTLSNGYANLSGGTMDRTLSGGGIGADGIATILNCTIRSNYSKQWGGGVFLWNGGIISNCIIEKNVGGFNSCGGLGFRTAATAVNCRVSGNYGAGIYVYISGGASWTISTIRNCVVSHNYVTRDNYSGMGITYQGNTTIENCTIVSNYIIGTNCSAAGIAVEVADYRTTNIVIRNCIIYSNSAANIYSLSPDWSTNGSTGTVFYSCSSSTTNGMEGSGNITNWPMFVDWGATNLRLAARSPCVNAGTNLDWMTDAVDLDGRPRIRYGTVDIGAYERIYNATIYGFR